MAIFVRRSRLTASEPTPLRTTALVTTARGGQGVLGAGTHGIALDDDLLDRRRNDPLDPLQEIPIRRRHQRDGAAIETGAARPAGAVHIVFSDQRQIKIHHQRQLRNVESARSDVCRHEDADLA
jgi:hypothetical protein